MFQHKTNFNQKISHTWMLLSILAILLAACMPVSADTTANSGEKATIKIGAVFDLTGPTSDAGTPYAAGVKGYVEWSNENGGIEGQEIELFSQDYQYAVDQAEALYAQYVGQEGVVAFQGWGTGDTEALRGRIADDQIPFMSGSYSANLADIETSPYNFLVGTTYSDQMVIALRWLLEDWAAQGNDGTPAVAVLHHDSPFGLSPLADGEAFAGEQGIAFSAIPTPRGAIDLTAELTQAQAVGANYIVIQNTPTGGALIAKDVARLGLEMQIICLNWCADETMVTLSGEVAEGIVGTVPFTPPSIDVPGMAAMRTYLEAKGEDLNEYGVHYSQGWATMAVMAEGIKRVLTQGEPLTGPNLRAALETLEDFETGDITAPITFTPTDHRGNRALRLFQVQDGQWQLISDYISAE